MEALIPLEDSLLSNIAAVILDVYSYIKRKIRVEFLARPTIDKIVSSEHVFSIDNNPSRMDEIIDYLAH